MYFGADSLTTIIEDFAVSYKQSIVLLPVSIEVAFDEFRAGVC